MNAVDDFIADLPEEQKALVDYIRLIIMQLDDGIDERIAWSIPFFYYQKPLCYINPLKQGVDIGFYFGSELSQRKEFRPSKRKMVRSLFFKWEDDVDIGLIKTVVLESIAYVKTRYDL